MFGCNTFWGFFRKMTKKWSFYFLYKLFIFLYNLYINVWLQHLLSTFKPSYIQNHVLYPKTSYNDMVPVYSSMIYSKDHDNTAFTQVNPGLRYLDVF